MKKHKCVDLTLTERTCKGLDLIRHKMQEASLAFARLQGAFLNSSTTCKGLSFLDHKCKELNLPKSTTCKGLSFSELQMQVVTVLGKAELQGAGSHGSAQLQAANLWVVTNCKRQMLTGAQLQGVIEQKVTV